jgi:hypothetical protein
MQELNKLIASDIPVLLWGAPGTGKTAAVTKMAADAGAHIEVLIGSTMDPTDLGRPYMTDSGVEVAPPPWARRLRGALDKGGEAWLMLDELTCAPPSIQAALLRVVQERRVVDLDLRGVKIIGAANPPEYAADPTDLSAATANRWCHLDWTLNNEEWIAGELGGWGTAGVGGNEGAEGRALVTGWISHAPSALLDPPKESAATMRGWPSPRSWSAVSKLLGMVGPERVKDKEVRACISGLVGGAACTEFTAWLADTELPNGKDLLDGKVELPSRGDRVALSLNSAVSVALAYGRMGDLFKLLVKARKDVALVATRRAVRAAVQSNIEIPQTPEKRKLVDSLTGADQLFKK